MLIFSTHCSMFAHLLLIHYYYSLKLIHQQYKGLSMSINPGATGWNRLVVYKNENKFQVSEVFNLKMGWAVVYELWIIDPQIQILSFFTKYLKLYSLKWHRQITNYLCRCLVLKTHYHVLQQFSCFFTPRLIVFFKAIRTCSTFLPPPLNDICCLEDV